MGSFSVQYRGECYEIINNSYAPLTERLRTLSSHIAHSDAYYAAAINMIKQPTREHADLAVKQTAAALKYLAHAAGFS